MADDTIFWRDESPAVDEKPQMVMLPFPRKPACLGPEYDQAWWEPVGQGSCHPPETVSEWQRRLLHWYILTQDCTARDLMLDPGFFCEGTKFWTCKFQSWAMLPMTGVVDPPTDDRMLEILQPR